MATMSGTDVGGTIERYWQAMGERDFDTVRALFSDDIVGEWPQSGERFRGKDACINVYAAYPGGSPKLIEVRRVTASGDLAVAEAELEYPDGKRYLTVTIFAFRDGKIAHEVDYFAERFPAPEWRMQWVDRD